MFRLETSTQHGVPVIQIFGNLDFGSARRLEETIQRLAQENVRPDLLIDLAHSQMVDSAGLGILVKSHRACLERGGTLKLTGINDKIAKLLGVTHLNGLFEIYEDLASGVAAFAQRGNSTIS